MANTHGVEGCSPDGDAAIIPGAPSAEVEAALEQLEVSALIHSQDPETVDERSQRYLSSFRELMSERACKIKGASFASGSTCPPAMKAAPNKPAGGLMELPARRKPEGGMTARRRAQAQVDEAQWRKTSSMLA